MDLMQAKDLIAAALPVAMKVLNRVLAGRKKKRKECASTSHAYIQNCTIDVIIKS